MSFAEMWDTGGQACFGRVESRTIKAMLLDIHMKVQKKQLDSTTLEFREKSSSVSSFPFPKRWIMVSLKYCLALHDLASEGSWMNFR